MRLRKSYKAIYGTMDTVQNSGAVIADRASALNGKYNNLEGSKVASTYDSLPLLSIITFGTW
jgi:hypothetical protein